MDALLLCCAVVALASRGSAHVSPGYDTTTEATRRRHDRAADDWLGASVRDDSVDTLDLASRDIQRVPRAAFRNTPNVNTIYLSNSSISDVDVGAFEGVPELETLDLDYNDISSLPEAVFNPVPGLVDVDLSDNRIAELSPSHFAGLTRMEFLWVNNNRAQLQVHNRTFANLPHLWWISLSSSNIRTLPRDVFANCTELHYINLKDNKIEELDNSIFYGLTELLVLNLSGNRLQTLQPSVFDELPSLKFLDLSSNRINYLSEENMHYRWNPSVDLTHNKIQYLDPHLYNNNRQAPTFILNSNPYHCCSLLSFIQKYSSRDIHFPTLVIDSATCAAPAQLRGTPLRQLSEDSLGDCYTTPPNTLEDSITTTALDWTPRPENLIVTETLKHSSITTPPTLSSTSSTSSTPSPVTLTSTLRNIYFIYLFLILGN